MAGCKVVTTKWLDVNKGDDSEANYRSRLVGRELKLDNRLDLFAATPPLEALRLVCAICANNQTSDKPYRILSVDVRRAYFYAKVNRPVFIEIPAEDRVPGDEGMVAKLNLSLYGTRDAAQNWAAEYTKYLRAIGFQTGRATPCSFKHASRELYVTVHGDAFTITGPNEDLRWLEEQLKKKYDIKTSYLGPESEHNKEIRVLNRTLRWTDDGIEYEPDRRHAELIIKDMEVSGAKPMATPGVSETKEETDGYDDSPELVGSEATAYHGLAVRLHYLAMDRPDLQVSAKEISKKMAKPRAADWSKLKRLARYLVGAPRMVQKFPWQEAPDRLETYTDSDWAGDRKSWKSTSVGAVTWGRHTIKTWSSTQQVIAMPSGEAELYALVKRAAQSYGIMAMLADFGLAVSTTVCTDASAALGMVHRMGLGKTRHIDVQYLWVQKDVLDEKLKVVKVSSNKNPADLLTKHLKAELILRHLEALNCEVSDGRAATAPMLQQVRSRDYWIGKGVQWARAHCKHRESRFTPMKVAGGPKNAGAVDDIRVATGRYKDGEHFCIIDRWKDSPDPHRRLREEWTGTTYFVERSAEMKFE